MRRPHPRILRAVERLAIKRTDADMTMVRLPRGALRTIVETLDEASIAATRHSLDESVDPHVRVAALGRSLGLSAIADSLRGALR